MSYPAFQFREIFLASIFLLLLAAYIHVPIAPTHAQTTSESAETMLKHIAELLSQVEAAHGVDEQIALLEQAIALASALPEWPRGMPREAWLGLIRHSLGKRYMSRANHDRAANIDRAIAAFEAVKQAIVPKQDLKTWIENQDALGRAYIQRIRGDRQENLKKASEAFEPLRAMLDRQNAPEAWAAVMSNLGYVYSQLDLGDREDSIELAIADLGAAGTVLTKDEYPNAWAVNQTNLSEAFTVRKTGVRAENLRKAIAAAEAAQTVFARGTDPRWTVNESARGKNLLALAELQGDAPETRDEAAQNTLKAIAALETALKLTTREDNPRDWANLHFALAIASAYGKNVAGAPENSERRATESYEAFLAVASRQEEPTRWADAHADMAHLLLGAEFRSDAKNVERAVSSLNAAATVYTRADYPDAWAQLQAGFGLAYFLRSDGERADNLERAIDFYETALKVLRPDSNVPKWGDVQNNLGSALFERVRGDREANLQRAIEAYKAALTVRTRERFPQARAETQNNLAIVYAARRDGDRGENIDAAVAAFTAAQTVYTRSSDPELWVKAELQIADLLMQHPRDPADKIERAITSLQACAEIYARETHLREWAFVERHFGRAYHARYSGSRADNLEQSIAHYRAALSVLTRETEPDAWAGAMNGLGLTYTSRIRGPRPKNIEQALEAYDEAQSVHTRASAPLDWAMIQNNRGLALVERSGERESIDAAIDAFRDAIAVYDDQRSLRRWAEAQNNLGLALHLCISGSRADNIEQSIAAFEAALGATAPAQYPDFWATAEANLANSLLDRIHGLRADNIDEAIRKYQLALAVQTRERYPEDWARLQTDIGAAFRLRVWGNRPENLERAITAYQQALTVLTQDAYPERWAFATMSLGHAYRSRAGGNIEANVDEALAAYADAAKVFTREQDPENWAILQSNIGSAYLQIRLPTSYDQAQQHLEAALFYIGADTRPREHLVIVCSLGDIAAARSDWSRALAHYQDAIATFRLLFGMGLDAADAQDVIASGGSLFANAAYATAKLGDLRRAFDLFEDGKARLLSLSLRIDTLSLTAEQRVRRNELVAKIQSAERSYRLTAGVEKTAFLAELAELRRQLAELIRSHEGAEAAATAGPLDRLTSFLQQHRAVVAPVVTDEGGMVFVATARDGAIRLSSREVPNLTRRAVAEFARGTESSTELSGWFGAYQANYVSRFAGRKKWQAWLDAIDGLGPALWNIAGRGIAQALSAAGVAPGAEVIVIPQGTLGILPLGLAQDPVTERRLMDDYVVTYVPSVTALAAIEERLRASRPQAAASLAAVINPTSDLKFSAIEGALVEGHFAPSDRVILEGDAATVSAVLETLKGRTYWHFASHGKFNWMDASAAGLLLKKEVLSVASLSGASELGTPRLVVLSACETGLHDTVRTPDEFSGLPAAFVRLGAVGVLSTLWPVNDLSTSLLISKFYDLHRKQSLPPARALKLAQAWIRQASRKDLRDYAQAARRDGRLPRDLAAALTELRGDAGEAGDACPMASSQPPMSESKRVHEPDEVRSPRRHRGTPSLPDRQRPFAHPFYWGGFVLTGE
jgi:CHAT domain-containing protein/tetratricopeptide (TPR) repeat protein